MQFIEPSEEHSRPKKDYPAPVENHEAGERWYRFESANARLQVTILTDRMARFRFVPTRFKRDFSYAIDPRFRADEVSPVFHDRDTHYEIATTAIRILVSKENLEVTVTDPGGRVISQDQGGYHFEANKEYGGHYVYCTKKCMPDEYFFGLGDKPSNLNLRGQRYRNWGTDTYGFTRDQDPLYRSFPFYYGLHGGLGYGIFFDNSFCTWFDFASEDPELVSFWAEGGEMNYYFMYGPGLLSVAEQYARLTGVPDLPPAWALGYHQSRWSYYPESKVREIAREFRARRIPCDVIHLDIDYMDGFRCFTWDRERFPDPPAMIRELAEEGFHIVTIIDPGIKVDPEYAVYREALANRFFCRRQDGDLMTGRVWPGECCFPDFTNPAVRTWWSKQCRTLIDAGVQGIWNDMNEPAVFEEGTFPADVRHDYEGMRVSHRKAHNVYGMQMARATYEAYRQYRPDRRPFVLTRSGYAGVQRFAAIWTGDNVSSWEHLWIGNVQCQRMSVSGVSFIGTDIGGFIGDPDGELFTRYLQMAVFHPFFRGHSSADHGDKEPWAFGAEFEQPIRRAVELRYRLLPYHYTTFWQHVDRGTPMIRPLAFLDQADAQTWQRMDEFGFGDQLLVCPIGEAGATGRSMYLPAGSWVNYWTGKAYRGGREWHVDAAADTFPLFVRAGAVVPHASVRQHAGEAAGDITLHVYYSSSRHGSQFYEDAGDGYGYLEGDFSVKHFTVFGNRKRMRVLQRKDGLFRAGYESYTVEVHGLPFRPRRYRVDGREMKAPARKRSGPLVIRVAENFSRIEIE